jgi:hypothetical protein
MLFMISEYCLRLYSTAAVPCAVVKLHIVTGVPGFYMLYSIHKSKYITPHIMFCGLLIFKIGFVSVILKYIFVDNNFISLEKKGHTCAHRHTHKCTLSMCACMCVSQEVLLILMKSRLFLTVINAEVKNCSCNNYARL